MGIGDAGRAGIDARLEHLVVVDTGEEMAKVDRIGANGPEWVDEEGKLAKRSTAVGEGAAARGEVKAATREGATKWHHWCRLTADRHMQMMARRAGRRGGVAGGRWNH
ncbi:hypothetical protein AXF42_Ash008987 [Apostasia shenzhenica]|uniref:Uncharacterized protein n=1 Tax=Apostasia shenzhenica TaxID=1088818 RepID=A0A2I0AD57_9ASPA|nr:hypothetical protein AXF42_Ash008987 [Apostasia shenzhenica]